jgi:uncharacterized membrane protein YfcA
MSEVLMLFIAGLAIGLVSSVLGIGGGIIFIPLLHWLYPALPIQDIMSMSLINVFVTTIINNINFHRTKQNPGLKLILCICLTSGLGGVIGSQLISHVDQSLAKLIFAGLVLVAGIRTLVITLIFKGKNTKYPHQRLAKINVAVPLLFIGLTGGFISGLTGLGGGFIYVPLLMSLGIHHGQISPLSNWAMLVSSLFAIIPALIHTDPIVPFISHSILFKHFHHGHIYFLVVLVTVLGSLFTSLAGVKLNSRVSAEIKGFIFGTLQILVAIKFLLF